MDENYKRLLALHPFPGLLLEAVDNGRDFKTLAVNDAICKMEDREPDQFIGSLLSEQPHAESLIELCQKAIESKQCETLSIDFTRKEQHIWLDLNALSLGDELLFFYYQDVSEKEQLFPVRGESSRLLKSLFDVTPDWIFIKDQDYRYIFVNDGFAHAVGTTPTEIIGKTDEEVGFPHHMIFGDEEKNIRGFRQDDTEVLTTGRTVYNPYDPATFADGSVHVFDTRKIPLYNDQERVYGVLGIARDITHRQEMEDALARSEERSRALLEATFDAALLVSKEGEVLAHNGRCRELFPGLMIGEMIFDKLSIIESGLLTLVSNSRKRIEEGGKVFDIAYNPILTRKKEAYQMAIFIRDISHEQLLEDQLRQSEKMRAVGQLAGGIAHDFNNQLFGIVGYLELLMANTDDDNLSRYINNAIRSANRAADLTKQLLAFSRKGKNLTVAVDLHELMEEVITMLERSVDKRIVLKSDFSKRKFFTLGDPTQIQNALLNLALNARDAMPGGGVLLFKSQLVSIDEESGIREGFNLVEGNYVKLTIRDTGIGIPKKYQGRIFEPFYTTKPEGRGVGMGLSAVYGTVNNHHGAIEVDSEVGQGTAMNLYFPLFDQEEKKGCKKECEVHKKGSGFILVIDDEEFVSEVATELLQELGYEVIAFNDPMEGLEYYRINNSKVDLVLFDMVMPGLNGIDLFRRMITINPKVKGVLMSGYGIDGQAQEVLDLGAKSFLSKPFTAKDLSNEIGKLIT